MYILNTIIILKENTNKLGSLKVHFVAKAEGPRVCRNLNSEVCLPK